MAALAELVLDPRPFWDHVFVGDDCWEWTGTLGAGGFGRVIVDGKPWYAHRMAWRLWSGALPERLYHLCRNRTCCRPAHLSVTRPARPAEERFWEKVAKTDGCWEWTGAKHRHGYGAFEHVGTVYAHRVAWVLQNGPVPTGLELDHLCKNKPCVRPDHLEPVTHTENVRRAGNWWRAQTHCRNGHEYIEETTLWWRGRRLCLICKRAAARRYNAHRRGQ